MREKVWAVLLMIGVVFGVIKWAGETESKKPEEEEVTFTQQRKLQSGQLLNVQTVRCKVCHQVISYIETDSAGKIRGGFVRTGHHCGHAWGLKDDEYRGLGVGPKKFNLYQWLELWQKRLSH